ncbi:MAG TPA: hypothetical protein VEK15_08850 [Vicinamibacteria bacterium]|nr:hypothetical protein [Vicinamibacteria bacterium]
MIDRELVTRKLTLILEDLKSLETLARKPREEHWLRRTTSSQPTGFWNGSSAG